MKYNILYIIRILIENKIKFINSKLEVKWTFLHAINPFRGV